MELKENLLYEFAFDDIRLCVRQAQRYAYISLPWTLNRMQYTMDKPGLERRLRNIILGKVPEYLVENVFRDYHIRFERQAGDTDFWQRDKFDFLLYINGHPEEWDLKCLMLPFGKIAKSDWMKLPALVPHRHKNDQWAERNHTVLAKTKQKRFLFAYLDTPSLFVKLQPSQVDSYNKIINNPEKYIRQDDFILRTLGGIETSFPSEPLRLVISAVAAPAEWDLFKTIPAGTKLAGGIIKTRIRNVGVPIQNLPSFLQAAGRKKRS